MGYCIIEGLDAPALEVPELAQPGKLKGTGGSEKLFYPCTVQNGSVSVSFHLSVGNMSPTFKTGRWIYCLTWRSF